MFNFHCHTLYCGHGLNTPEEMIKSAVDMGLSSIGISEHYGKDINGNWFGHSIKDPDNYIKDCLSAKEKYKDKIDIQIGFEMDFQFYNYKEIYSEIMSYNPDYILGSIHWMAEEENFNIFEATEDNLYEIIRNYLTAYIKMINTGYINSLDHFDMYKKFAVVDREEELYPYYEELAKALKANNVAMEINTHYYYEGIYTPDPNHYMLRLAKEYDIPVIVSSDAHSTDTITCMFDEAFEVLKEVGIKTTCRFKNRQVIKEPFNP